MPHVDAVSGALYAIGNYRDPGLIIPILGVDPEQMAIIYPDWGITPADAALLEHSRSAALVTAAMMKRYHWKIGDKVTFSATNLPTDIDGDHRGQSGCAQRAAQHGHGSRSNGSTRRWAIAATRCCFSSASIARNPPTR